MDGDKMMIQDVQHKTAIAADFQCPDRGFTLIEVMVALVILLVGMLGVMGMQYYAVTGNTTSREMRIATNLNRDMVEQIKSTAYADLSSGTDNPFEGVYDTAMTGGMQNVSRAWWVLSDCIALTLTSDDNTCSSGLVPACTADPDASTAVAVSAVRTRTCWSDKHGSNHSVTFDTLRWDENVVP